MPSKRPRRTKAPHLRKGTANVQITHAEFVRRFRERFVDPTFAAVDARIAEVAEVAWRNYDEYHKSPTTRRAGRGFAEPEFELPTDWLDARAAVRRAAVTQRKRRSPTRILVVNGSARSDQSCPGEMSKSHRLAEMAMATLRRAKGTEVDYLDLSLLTSQYGRTIFPCKACVSTAMPLCHWPCSCYPNHAMGQVQDWMNEIYPRWVAAHGVFLVTPVHWYQAPSVLKLMIDRLVCADGGNADPTTTHGKDPLAAKKLELAGWPYPKHLAGRAFAVVVHGDAAGVENLRRMLCDWLTDLDLVQAGPTAAIDRYLGYYQPYANSHDDLDRDTALQAEVKVAAKSLLRTVRLIRAGKFQRPDHGIEPPREK
jgi:multimeric flavodoxin WrbA